ncbi:outer membrane beta-barrel protein [Sphingomonas sp. SFZ2018-12]|uniref:OmpW/AlkL family protein n=1 Tax=Sphingomonas sp. SFZ2018-12 TaxID=2683197 RepID=UPI001F102021|nr:OmpW family protein [Sphingomonas sp. SFZ2018-12]MCH4894646.1 outer membrane beta-barrel protein [Sphingomonas sp. SFZ2018-12]
MLKSLSVAAVIATLAVTAPAQAKQGDVLVRLRGIVVAPTGTSDGIAPSFPTGRVKVGTAVMPEVDITYMASDHIGFELIAATTPHGIEGAGAIGSVRDLGRTWALPPTLTAQYHFLPESKVRPYIGAGINYTIFYATKAGSDLVAAVGPTRIKLKDSVGYALQAGVDIDLNKRFFANVDVKYVDMDPRVRLDTGGLINTTRVHIDPIVVGVGIGARF